MNIGIIGCGLIGKKRALNLEKDDRVLAVCDTNENVAKLLAQELKCPYSTQSLDILLRKDVEAVIIATPHNNLAAITSEAIREHKHIFVEKPAARSADELAPILRQLTATNHSSSSPLIVKVGFNHRFHPAMQKVRKIIDEKTIGELMFLRGRYGHGGRLGYEKEWRASREIAGGGELLDQGPHLIDLARWYLGDFSEVYGITKTLFWKMPVEDNAFLIMETDQNQVAQIHVSWTEWKNLFSLEIYGQYGKLHIEGLGGSYGAERLTHYQMSPAMGPPSVQTYEYPGPDDSWKLEWQNFKGAINRKNMIIGDLDDAYQTLAIIQKVYSLNNGK